MTWNKTFIILKNYYFFHIPSLLTNYIRVRTIFDLLIFDNYYLFIRNLLYKSLYLLILFSQLFQQSPFSCPSFALTIFKNVSFGKQRTNTQHHTFVYTSNYRQSARTRDISNNLFIETKVKLMKYVMIVL